MRKHFVMPALLLALVVFTRPWETERAGSIAPRPATPVALEPAFAALDPASTVGEETALALATTLPTETPSPSSTPTMTASPTVIPTLPPPVVTDPPALEPQVAPPTPAPTQQEAPHASRPARLVIPAIGLDLQPVSVGLDESRVPIVPKHDAGWYNLSAMPGQPSNIVFWGHVLRWKDSPRIPAPFARLNELRPGADIIIRTADGKRWHYRVTQQVQARPDEVRYILPTEGERLTLVSCIGDKVILDGTLTKRFRLITIAEPVQ